jgi:vacuolar-type H+-ATPase subunit F/Vma7
MTDNQQFKLGIIGNRSSIALYKSLGVLTYPVNNKQEAQDRLEDIVSQFQDTEKTIAQYAIVFMEETYYKQMPEDLMNKMAKKALPALIPVPSPESNDPQFGLKRISKIVERAVGTDIS